MKKIKELEVLVNFAKALGQTPDPAMVEQVRKHYELQKSIIESVKATSAKDLNAAFGITLIEENTNELVQPQTIEESTAGKETIPSALASKESTEELVQLNLSNEENLAERTAKFISEAPKKDSYQESDIPLTPAMMKAVQDKLKFLEQWLSKVSLAGPGGGAVNLKDLDDVSKYSIKNATENQYLTYNTQSKLWIATNHTNTNLYLNDLVDVVITAPRDGQVLKYDSVANAWVAAADVSVTQNGAPVISFSDLTVATLSPTEGGTLQYNSNTGVFSHAPSILDTLDSVTTRGNVTNNSITVRTLNIPVGSVISGESQIIASILNEELNAVLEYGNVANLSIGDYGLTNGITGVPYAVYQLKRVPNISLQIGDIVGGAAIPSISTILRIGTGANANVFVTNTNFAANAAIPLANTVLTFAREITNAGMAITTAANTDITLNPGIGGHIVPHADIIPYTTNQWSLGTPAKRFKELWLGTGTIYVEDETLGNDQALGARNGNFYIDGGAGLEVGEFTLRDNYISIGDPTRDVFIGTTYASGNININRPLQVLNSTGKPQFTVDRTGRTAIYAPTIPANDVGAFSIVGTSNGTYRPVVNPGGMLHISGNDGAVSRITNDAFGTGVFPAYISRAGRGTTSSPNATLAGDILSRYSTVGWGTTNFAGAAAPAATNIEVYAKENFTDTAGGTEYRFYTAPVGTTAKTFSSTIDSEGLSFVKSAGDSANVSANIGILFSDNTKQVTAFTSSAVNAYVRPMLTTANVKESTSNLYFTNTRVVSALSTDSTIKLYANGQITSNVLPVQLMAYGQFWDTTTQTCSANTSTLVKFNNADGRVGVNLANANTRIVLERAGTYNLQFSAQFVNGGNKPENAWIWFRQSNVDLPYSAGLTAVPKKDGAIGGALVVSWNTFATTNTANDYIELVWFTADDADNKLTYYPAANAVPGTSPAIPAIPSVILTVEQIR